MTGLLLLALLLMLVFGGLGIFVARLFLLGLLLVVLLAALGGTSLGRRWR